MPGQLEVEDQQVVARRARTWASASRPSPTAVHREAVLGEVEGDQLDDVGIVLDDQRASHAEPKDKGISGRAAGMRIVVAGGTGFIGSEVVKRLLERGGDEVVVTTRDPAGADPWDGRVRARAGLRRRRVEPRQRLHARGRGRALHPVPEPSRRGPVARAAPTWRWTASGTSVAVAAAKRVGVRRFVYLSGAGAGQGRPQPWFRAKDMAEAAIRESGLEHALLRPSWIYGPGDHSMNRFVAFCRCLPVVPGDRRRAGRRSIPSTWTTSRGAWSSCVHRDDAAGQGPRAGRPERLTMDEVIRTIQYVLGTRRPLLHHPGAADEAAGAAHGAAARAAPVARRGRLHRPGGRDRPPARPWSTSASRSAPRWREGAEGVRLR